MLAASGNVFSPQELEMLRARGAVGDICLRFFDADRQAGLDAARRSRHQHRAASSCGACDRVVGIAGGHRKTAAIRGALRGGLVNVLITDRGTAERLVQPVEAERPAGPRGGAASGPPVAAAGRRRAPPGRVVSLRRPHSAHA